MDLPSRDYRDKAALLCDPNQEAAFAQVIAGHPFVHCVEVLTKSQDPPTFPGFESEATAYQVLLDYKAFLDPEVVNDMLCETTRFVSLSPLDTGNGLFIQHGTIVFSLNDATYKRFGLTGIQCGSTHRVTITEGKKDQLVRIRPFQPIEGILISNQIGLYADYLKKFAEVDTNVVTWEPTVPFDFDPELIGAEEWRPRLLQAIDASMVSSHSLAVQSEWSKMVLEGVINLHDIKDWLMEVQRAGPTLIMIWDMDDIPGLYFGKSYQTEPDYRGAEGFGGGFEALLSGSGVPVAVRYQTCLYRNEE